MANNHKFVAHKVHLRRRICCSQRSSKHAIVLMEFFPEFSSIKCLRKNSHLSFEQRNVCERNNWPANDSCKSNWEAHQSHRNTSNLNWKPFAKDKLKIYYEIYFFYSFLTRKAGILYSFQLTPAMSLKARNEKEKKLSSQTFHIKCRCKSSLFDYVLL